MAVHQWSTYRSSTNFADPDTFDPERFLPSPPQKYRNDDRAALQPFLLGPRGCLGKGSVTLTPARPKGTDVTLSLAYFEMRSILARMLWHFEIQLVDESRDWTDLYEYAVWDRRPLWVRLQHRAGD